MTRSDEKKKVWDRLTPDQQASILSIRAARRSLVERERGFIDRVQARAAALKQLLRDERLRARLVAGVVDRLEGQWDVEVVGKLRSYGRTLHQERLRDAQRFMKEADDALFPAIYSYIVELGLAEWGIHEDQFDRPLTGLLTRLLNGQTDLDEVPRFLQDLADRLSAPPPVSD